MDAELIDRIRWVADEWERDAPPVSLHDVVAPRPSDDADAPPASPEVAVLESGGRRHRWWVVAAAAAAVVALIAGVTSLAHTRDDHTIVPPQESDVTESTTAPPSTTVSATTVAPTAEESFATMLDEVTAARAALDGFTATVTMTTSNPTVDATGTPLPPAVDTRTNRVVMLADGSLWSEGDRFLWSSFDPATGTARNAIVGADGTTQYQEVVGWTDASTPINILFGTDPLADLTAISVMGQAPDTTTQVEQVTSDLGRDAWRVTQSAVTSSDDQSGGITERTATWDIDRGTGVVVAYTELLAYNGVEQTTEMRVTELGTDAVLPAEFPGTFPDGAAVNRSGDPNGYVPMSVPAAAAAFGGPIYMPASFGDDAVASVTTQRQVWGSGTEENSTMKRLEIRRRLGFTTATVSMFEFVLDPGAPVPDGMRVVDGLVCASADGITCVGGTGGSVIHSGALAGAPSTAEGNSVNATVGGVTVLVSAPLADDALALANSLVRVDPPK